MPQTARDPELKKQRGYTHPKSYVRADGSEVLHGKDWTKRKKELWVRCGGRCEQIVVNGVSIRYLSDRNWIPQKERCRSEAHDPHHIIPRSKRRDDRLSNLMALCRLHHELLDKRKVRWSKRSAA